VRRLHFSYNNNQPEGDWFCKTKPIIGHLKKLFSEILAPFGSMHIWQFDSIEGTSFLVICEYESWRVLDFSVYTTSNICNQRDAGWSVFYRQWWEGDVPSARIFMVVCRMYFWPSWKPLIYFCAKKWKFQVSLELLLPVTWHKVRFVTFLFTFHYFSLTYLSIIFAIYSWAQRILMVISAVESLIQHFKELDKQRGKTEFFYFLYGIAK
jgi:hypothetical protein